MSMPYHSFMEHVSEEKIEYKPCALPEALESASPAKVDGKEPRVAPKVPR